MNTITWLNHQGGYERCVLVPDPAGFHLGGTAVLIHAGQGYEIRYSILTDPDWRTRVVGVHVQGPDSNRRLALRSDGKGSWISGEQAIADLDGAIDVDLSFSPATNTLPIRRLGLGVGESAETTVAYVDIAAPDAVSARQEYTRTAQDVYRYRSGDIDSKLTVDDVGLVRDYPEHWEAVAWS